MIRKRLLERKGLSEAEPHRGLTAEDLENQTSPEFFQLMTNRMKMGAMRYGPVKGRNNPGRTHGWNVSNILKRANLYMRTGNAEHLVDVANFAMAEFIQRSHPDAHFEAKDRS